MQSSPHRISADPATLFFDLGELFRTTSTFCDEELKGANRSLLAAATAVSKGAVCSAAGDSLSHLAAELAAAPAEVAKAVVELLHGQQVTLHATSQFFALFELAESLQVQSLAHVCMCDDCWSVLLAPSTVVPADSCEFSRRRGGAGVGLAAARRHARVHILAQAFFSSGPTAGDVAQPKLPRTAWEPEAGPEEPKEPEDELKAWKRLSLPDDDLIDHEHEHSLQSPGSGRNCFVLWRSPSKDSFSSGRLKDEDEHANNSYSNDHVEKKWACSLAAKGGSQSHAACDVAPAGLPQQAWESQAGPG